MSIKVFLKARMSNLGKIGDEVTVNNGYARNFLIPKGIAVVINKSNIKIIERQKQELLEQENQLRERLQVIADKAVDLNFTLKMNDKGVAFGSVTTANILDRFKEQDIKLESKNLFITGALKQFGKHTITVQLNPEIKQDFIINIVGEEEKEEKESTNKDNSEN